MFYKKNVFRHIAIALISALLICTISACSQEKTSYSSADESNAIAGNEFYLHGNDEAGYLKFYEDGTVDIVIYHGTMYMYPGTASGEYEINDKTIEIKCDFEWFGDMELEIVDDYALVRHFEEDILIAADYYFIRSGRTGADYGIDGEGNPVEHGDNGDDDESDTRAAFSDKPMTAQLAEEIYETFINVGYEDYDYLTEEVATAVWEAYDAEERTLMYQQFSEIAAELGLSASNSESEWIESMDYYKYIDNLFIRSIISMDTDNDDAFSRLRSAYRYQKGLDEGKYEPLDDAILALADSLTVEYGQDSYLLCLGSDHSIQYMTYEWTVQEESFGAGGTVTAVKTDSFFTDIDVSYTINGEKGVFSNVKFGKTDFMPILKGIGAIDDSGAFITEQIDFCAVNTFDAELIYVLSLEDLGIITIAVAKFDEAQNEYIWDGQTYMSSGRCCFSKDDEFFYVDIYGDLHNLTAAYAGGE